MVRLPLLVLSLVAAAALPAWAQIQPRSLQTIDEPKGEFSLSLRYTGDVSVSFSGVGTLATTKNIGDSGETSSDRFYDDGYVKIDARTATDGTKLPDDGRTNTWRFAFADQIIDQDGDGAADSIAFHRYETRSDGATVDMDSSPAAGVDLDYSYAFGRFGGRMRNKAPRATWGGLVGLSVTNFNAKTNDSIKSTLITVTDLYSLDGATPPTPPYTAPSSNTASGGTIDTTTLLANRPYWRPPTQEVAEGADIDGFWQVRGGAFTGRAGLWARYKLHERLGVRLGAGLSASFVGLSMRYDEYLVSEDITTELRYANENEPDKWTYFGAYGTLDLELWVTGSTCVFAGATYEKLDKGVELELDGRTADVRFASGNGFRIGFTKLF